MVHIVGTQVLPTGGDKGHCRGISIRPLTDTTTLGLPLHGSVTDPEGPTCFGFCLFSATPVRRFICSCPVLAAGNCWLVVQLLLGDLV